MDGRFLGRSLGGVPETRLISQVISLVRMETCRDFPFGTATDVPSQVGRDRVPHVVGMRLLVMLLLLMLLLRMLLLLLHMVLPGVRTLLAVVHLQCVSAVADGSFGS